MPLYACARRPSSLSNRRAPIWMLTRGAGGYARSHAAQIERLPFTLIIFSDDLVAIAGQASDRLTQFDSVPNDFCDRSRVGRNPSCSKPRSDPQYMSKFSSDEALV